MPTPRADTVVLSVRLSRAALRAVDDLRACPRWRDLHGGRVQTRSEFIRDQVEDTLVVWGLLPDASSNPAKLAASEEPDYEREQ